MLLDSLDLLALENFLFCLPLQGFALHLVRLEDLIAVVLSLVNKIIDLLLLPLLFQVALIFELFLNRRIALHDVQEDLIPPG